MIRHFSLFIILCTVLFSSFCLGCGSGDSPTTPASSPTLSAESSIETGSNRMLWAFCNVIIDPTAGTAEIIPLRQAEFTCNVTKFMQPPVSSVQLLNVAINTDASDIPAGLVVCNITIQHPFPGSAMLRGFDVRGICMGDGTYHSGYDPADFFGGLDDLRLLDADGHTRWWNPTEFMPHGTIFSYTPGALASPSYLPTATLNGYKYFADEILADGPVILDPAIRGTFSVNPGLNTRRYEIQFPMIGGSPKFRFAYAIDASWAKPDPSGAPNYTVNSFSSDANCAEAYLITITDAGSTAWYVDANNNGGFLKLDIEVFDWQAPNNPLGVPGELAGLWLEGNSITAPVNVLANATVLPGGETSSIFRIKFQNLNLTHSGPNTIGIIAESVNPNTYEPNLDINTSPWTWPDSTLAAYLCTTVDIADTQPQVDIIYVDDSNESGVEDGTMAHPYDTIQEGLDAAEEDNEVRVDDSGNPYEGDVTLIEWIDLKSVNWDISDGDDEATIEGTVYGADNAAIEGFEIGSGYCGINCDGTSPDIINCRVVNLPGTFQNEARAVWLYNGSHAHLDGVEVDGVTNDDHKASYGILIQDCEEVAGEKLVLENTNVHNLPPACWDASYGIHITNSAGIQLNNCTVHDINAGGWGTAYGIYISGSDNAQIIDCIIHDVSGENYCTTRGIAISGSQNAYIYHCVIYKIKGISYSTTHGILLSESNDASVINTIVNDIAARDFDTVYGIQVADSVNTRLINNVIYDVRKYGTGCGGHGTAYGLYFSGCTNLDARNMNVTYIHVAYASQKAYGVGGGTDTYVFDYSDVYDCTTDLYINVDPGPHCISANPGYIDDGVDFHLGPMSPGLNQGDPDDVYDDPDGTRNDMGAYGGPGGDW